MTTPTKRGADEERVEFHDGVGLQCSTVREGDHLDTYLETHATKLAADQCKGKYATTLKHRDLQNQFVTLYSPRQNLQIDKGCLHPPSMSDRTKAIFVSLSNMVKSYGLMREHH